MIEVKVGEEFDMTWVDGHVEASVTQGEGIATVAVSGPNVRIRGVKAGTAELTCSTIVGSPPTLPSDPPVEQNGDPVTIPVTVKQ